MNKMYHQTFRSLLFTTYMFCGLNVAFAASTAQNCSTTAAVVSRISAAAQYGTNSENRCTSPALSTNGPLSKMETTEIERKIDYTFKDGGILTDVFRPSNLTLLRPTVFQELEFLGDKIISAFVAYSIFSRTEAVRALEQKLADRMKDPFFAEKFKSMGLERFLRDSTSSNLEPFYSRSFKALVGAMHLDAKQQGASALDKFRQFLVKILGMTALSVNAPNSSYFSRKGDIEAKLGYPFKEDGWMTEIFKQQSSFHQYGGYGSSQTTGFEQLEFLGDKILGAVIVDSIFSSKQKIQALKEQFEGKTKAQNLEQQLKRLALDEFLKDELKSRLGAAFKALTASILLDSSKERDTWSGSRRCPFFVVSPECQQWIVKMLDLNSVITAAMPAAVSSSIGRTVPEISAQDIQSIEDKIGYKFKDKKLLADAFYHSSLVQRPTEFEQLEFLGDRIINAVVAVSIFSGGDSTRILQEQFQSKTNNLYFKQKFAEMGFERLLQRNPTSNPDKVFGDAFEALVGAIYLDSRKPEAFFSVEVLQFVAKTLGLNPSSISIPTSVTAVAVPALQQPRPVAAAVPAVSLFQPQQSPSLVMTAQATSSGFTEFQIQEAIRNHKKWAGCTPAEQRKRAKQSLEAKRSAALAVK